MKSIQFIAILIFFSSCNSQKLALHVEKWKPYCGGAKPTEEMSKGLKTPFSGEKFKLYFKGKAASEKIISLDENGNWKGKIPKNVSCEIYRLDKTISLDELRKKYTKELGKFYTVIEDKEIILWQNQADFIIPIVTKKPVSFDIQDKCFVGLNPCIRYIGPLPQ